MACFMTLYIADNKHIVAQMFVQISKGFPYGETFEIFQNSCFLCSYFTLFNLPALD